VTGISASSYGRNGVGRSTWTAVAWLEGLTVAGLGLLGLAFVRSIRWCATALGCDGQSSGGGAEVALAALGLVALLAAPVLASRLSGRAAPVATSALALLAFVGVLAIGGILFVALVGNELPALVLALGVEGSIAVRPPTARAVNARVVVVASLVVLATVFGAGNAASSAIIFVLALITLPAIGLSDAIARGRERSLRHENA
jgi:hypothetical protein